MQPVPNDPVCGVSGSLEGCKIAVSGMAPTTVPCSQLSHTVNVSGGNMAEYSGYMAARNRLGFGNESPLGTHSESSCDCMYHYYCVTV